MPKNFVSCVVLALIVWGSVGSTQAQAPASRQPAAGAAPPAPAIPDRTTASYGDWTLRCDRVSGLANVLRVCEIVQAIIPQGQQQPIAQISIGRMQRTDPLLLTVMLPTNVALTATPKFAPEETGGVAGETTWQRCIPGGCFANTVLPDDMIRRLRARTAPGRIEFKDAAGRDLRIVFSTKGLTQALDALARE